MKKGREEKRKESVVERDCSRFGQCRGFGKLESTRDGGDFCLTVWKKQRVKISHEAVISVLFYGAEASYLRRM